MDELNFGERSSGNSVSVAVALSRWGATREQGLMLDVVAKAAVWEFHVECDQCATSIDVSVLVYKPAQSAAKQALNELLVDYGWVPTAGGGFCRAHTVPARRQ